MKFSYLLSCTDDQFEENASSRQITSFDSASIVAARESNTSSNPFITPASSDVQQLKDENKRSKQEKNILEKERDNLLAQQENHERELREKDEIAKQKFTLQPDLSAKEFQVHELETSLTTGQQALEDMQQLKDEIKRLKLQWEKKENDLLAAEKENFEKKLQDLQHEKGKLVDENNSLRTCIKAQESQIYELKTSLATAQQAQDQVQQLETTLATTQQLLKEYQQKESCDWIVCRDEVQMTDKCLGKGGWGKVVLGTFRGCKVAVKQIHELILSSYNRNSFEREMNIASRCRHPCLLQFIGATNDNGSPLFITELLERSLRALLELRQLADTEISIISLDVSLALNYLHNIRPSAIIHRDVSSPNVLLWRQGDQWRGKVSDYGTANFVQQTMTKHPGAAIYSAPEAASPNQTSKVSLWTITVMGVWKTRIVNSRE